jgi:hypothetical protein
VPLEAVKLTANFKLSGPPEGSFSMYGGVPEPPARPRFRKGVREAESGEVSRSGGEYPSLPSHYIYMAYQMACSIYKRFRELKRMRAWWR